VDERLRRAVAPPMRTAAAGEPMRPNTAGDYRQLPLQSA